MIKPTRRKFAIEYATYYHDGQKRKDGSPYVEHPKRVANYVALYKDSSHMENLLCAAVLHDVIEDTDATYLDILDNFGIEIASLVQELTNDFAAQKALGKAQYLSDKMIRMTSWALVLKLCDRLDNVKDLVFAPDDFKKRYINETLEILKRLTILRELTETHQAIVDDIYNEISRFAVDSML